MISRTLNDKSNFGLSAGTRRRLSLIATIAFAVAVALFILTFSIGLPIYIRPFYYAHIGDVQYADYFGWDYDTMKAAYDEMITYCTTPGAEFGTGELLYSESGASHFADCKSLFTLNWVVFTISGVVIVATYILKKMGFIDLRRPLGFDVTFFSSVGLLLTFTVIALLASADFSAAFTIFHKIFFPGKDNWLFDPRTDQIILLLPQSFFMDCAILILISIMTLSALFITLGIIRREKAYK